MPSDKQKKAHKVRKKGVNAEVEHVLAPEAPTLEQIVKIRTLQSKTLSQTILNKAIAVGIVSCLVHFACYIFIFNRIRPIYHGDFYLAESLENKSELDYKEFLIKANEMFQTVTLSPISSQREQSLSALNATFHEFYQPSTFYDTFATLLPYKKLIITILEGFFAFGPSYFLYEMFSILTSSLVKYTNQQTNEIVIKQNMNTIEAQEFIQSLIEKEKALDLSKSKNLEIIGGFTGVGIFLLYGLLTSLEGDTSSYILLIALYMTACAGGAVAMTSIKNLFNILNEDSLKDKLELDKTVLRSMLPENLRVATTINIHEGDTEKNSYLSMSFVPYLYQKTKKLSAHTVCKVVISVLKQHDIKITDYQSKDVVLSHDSINKIKTNAASITADIHAAIENYKDIKKFTGQIKKITQFFAMEGFHRPAYTKKGELTREFFYEVNMSFTDAQLNKLKDLYPQSMITKTNNILEITASKPCQSKALMNAFNTSAALFVPAPGAMTITNFDGLDNTSDNKTNKKGKQTSANNGSENNNNTSEPVLLYDQPSLPADRLKITWASGLTYNSLDPDCRVKVLTGKALPDRRFFIFFALTEEDLKSCPGAHKKFSKMTNLAIMREGAQGAVYVDEDAKDLDGKTFRAKIKLKAKKKLGKARAFGSEETNDAGYTVYNIKGFNPHYH